MANRKQRRDLERRGYILQPDLQPLPAGNKVCFANVNPGQVSCELFGTFVQLVTKDMQTTHHIDSFICRRSGGLLSIFRNGVVAEFIDDTTSDWIFMVDSDIVLEDDTLNLLMDAAKANPQAEIVSGWYVLPMMEEGNRPDVFRWTGANFEYQDVPEETGYVDSVGLGCVIIHRRLLEKMYTKYGLPSPWFTLMEFPPTETERAHIFGEDHSFFLRTMQDFSQRPLLVPACHVGHVKSVMLTKEHVDVV